MLACSVDALVNVVVTAVSKEVTTSGEMVNAAIWVELLNLPHLQLHHVRGRHGHALPTANQQEHNHKADQNPPHSLEL